MNKMRTLGAGGPVLHALGLGCMGMSEFYGAADDANSLAVLRRAEELGIKIFDTADTYGLGHNERLIGQFLKESGDDIFIATKFGIRREPGAYARGIDNSPGYIRAACEASLERLGVETIDLYYAHRITPEIPVEETVGVMAQLVKEGKARYLGLCEVSAETLRRAHAVHPIAALQTEYSLSTRDVETAVLPACRELGVAFVAYSPLGRGLLSGTIRSATDLAENDFRRRSARFATGNLDENLKALSPLQEVARRHGATPAQIALAWVLHQGEDIFAIPGTRHLNYLEANFAAADIALTEDDLGELDAAFRPGVIAGARYPAEGMKGINA